jgi:virginiamycin A acetyltransferase
MANHFHPESIISTYARIDVSARGTDTIIGAFCQIDDFVRIRHVGGTGHVVLGERVYLNAGTVIYSGNGVTIGNDVMIGPNCNIVAANHAFSNTDIPMRAQGFAPSKGGIIIEDDVWIAAGVTICDGAIIRKGCVVGAHAVVMGELPAYAVCHGSPARMVRSRKEDA